MEHQFIVDARRTAENAVADMPEGALKTAAFQTILAQLLQNHEAETGRPASLQFETTRPKTKARVPGGTTGRILGLINEGIFDQQRSLAEIRHALSERGWHYNLEDIGTPVTRLVRRRLLRRSQVSAGGKKIWKYAVH
jgi:hypothetical protein